MRNENANTHTHEQKSDGKTVSGSYRVDLPDGRIQVVSYIADEKGYRADVRYENTLDLSKYYPSESIASTEPPRYQSETSPEPQVYEKKEPSITLPASNYNYETEEIHRAPTSEREYVNNQPPARETYSEPPLKESLVYEAHNRREPTSQAPHSRRGSVVYSRPIYTDDSWRERDHRPRIRLPGPPRYQSENIPEPQFYERNEPSSTLPASNYDSSTREIHRDQTREKDYASIETPNREIYLESPIRGSVIDEAHNRRESTSPAPDSRRGPAVYHKPIYIDGLWREIDYNPTTISPVSSRYQSEISPEPRSQVYERKEPPITLPAANFDSKVEEIHRDATSETEYINTEPRIQEKHLEPPPHIKESFTNEAQIPRESTSQAPAGRRGSAVYNRPNYSDDSWRERDHRPRKSRTRISRPKKTISSKPVMDTQSLESPKMNDFKIVKTTVAPIRKTSVTAGTTTTESSQKLVKGEDDFVSQFISFEKFMDADYDGEEVENTTKEIETPPERIKEGIKSLFPKAHHLKNIGLKKENVTESYEFVNQGTVSPLQPEVNNDSQIVKLPVASGRSRVREIGKEQRGKSNEEENSQQNVRTIPAYRTASFRKSTIDELNQPAGKPTTEKTITWFKTKINLSSPRPTYPPPETTRSITSMPKNEYQSTTVKPVATEKVNGFQQKSVYSIPNPEITAAVKTVESSLLETIISEISESHIDKPPHVSVSPETYSPQPTTENEEPNLKSLNFNKPTNVVPKVYYFVDQDSPSTVEKQNENENSEGQSIETETDEEILSETPWEENGTFWEDEAESFDTETSVEEKKTVTITTSSGEGESGETFAKHLSEFLEGTQNIVPETATSTEMDASDDINHTPRKLYVKDVLYEGNRVTVHKP